MTEEWNRNLSDLKKNIYMSSQKITGNQPELNPTILLHITNNNHPFLFQYQLAVDR